MKKILLPLLLLSTALFSQNKEIGTTFIQTLLVEKNFSKAYAQFDESIKGKLSENLLKDTEQQLHSQLGNFNKIIEINQEGNTYFYYSDFDNMKLDIKLALSAEGKVMGFFFTPHKDFSAATDLGEALSIKSNNVQLKGTLLIPKEANLKKLVIFVHGSGPQDRNETIGQNKPFKDIAEKLFQKGIASYRFDKRTLSNPETFTEKITIDDEVTSDILNIIAFFKGDKNYSDYEIIVLGHSLGANLGPRIASRSNQIGKLVLLAGNARTMDELIVEQYDYLYKLNPTPAMQKETTAIKEQVNFLHSKDFAETSPKEKLPLNLPGYYWKSVLDYHPLQEIQKVRLPILVLQGERDYQVTMTDFNLWKKTLQSNKKAECISYPKLNHLFMTGESPATPQDYEVKGTVEEKVINDIAAFVAK